MPWERGNRELLPKTGAREHARQAANSLAFRTLVSRASCATAIVLCLATATLAQEESDTRNETWPELQVLVRTSPKTRLFFVASMAEERESRKNLDAQMGGHFDYLASRNLWFRAGYRYSKSLSPEDDYREHRIVAEQTLKTTLPGRIVASDRNRQDFRFVRGDYSFRYRNRLMLERDVTTARGYRFTPYVQGELYFDSRFRTWNRNRYGVGVTLPLSKPATTTDPQRASIWNHASLDVYYMRQNDSRSSPHHVNALGAALILSF